MQSYLQYKRLERSLQEKIITNGVDAAAGSQDRPLAKSVPECAHNIAPIPAKERNATVPITQAFSSAVDGEKGEEELFIVKFETTDFLNPKTWSNARKWTYTFLIGATGFIVSGATAFDTPVTPQAAAYFGVSQEVALLSTTLYMIALGFGSLVRNSLHGTEVRISKSLSAVQLLLAPTLKYSARQAVGEYTNRPTPCILY